MALYVVERDLNNTPTEQFRLDQREVASACTRLKAQGKLVRYISSAVVPSDGRALDLFGAASAELIEEAHASAGVHYARIVEILDLTPSFLSHDTSRPRRSLRRGVGAATILDDREGTEDTMAATSSSELARWLLDGQRLFGMCLEALESSERLRSENGMLREEVARLRHRLDVLQADRSEMVAAFNDLAGHVTQVVDHIIQKSEDGEDGK
jgi:hypothetical protein